MTPNTTTVGQRMDQAVETRMRSFEKNAIVQACRKSNPGHARRCEANVRKLLRLAFQAGLEDGTGTKHMDEVVQGAEQETQRFLSSAKGRRLLQRPGKYR